MRVVHARSLSAVLVLSAFTLAACQSGREGDASAEATATASADATTATTTGGAVTTLDGVRSAVIRIVAEGTFVDPNFGEQLNAAGSGSGFIISASGIAVTNNHVVTGAGLVRVFLDGNSQPVNARLPRRRSSAFASAP